MYEANIAVKIDKLGEFKQSEIKKMSTERLASKLSQAGVALEQLKTMDRAAMMEAWADIVSKGKEWAVLMGTSEAPLHGDIDLERQQFEFGKMKF